MTAPEGSYLAESPDRFGQLSLAAFRYSEAFCRYHWPKFKLSAEKRTAQKLVWTVILRFCICCPLMLWLCNDADNRDEGRFVWAKLLLWVLVGASHGYLCGVIVDVGVALEKDAKRRLMLVPQFGLSTGLGVFCGGLVQSFMLAPPAYESLEASEARLAAKMATSGEL